MRRPYSVNFAFLLVWATTLGATALAETTVYQFIPGQSTVIYQNWSWGYVEETRSVAGKLWLSVNSDAGLAWFDQVDAELSEEILCLDCYDNEPDLVTKNLGVLFHMSELKSTDVNDAGIKFVYERNIPTFPHADVHLTLTFTENSVHLTGRFSEACYDCGQFDLDAVALKKTTVYYVDDDGPADFNNIQAAIDDANNGDTIIVQQGLYEQSVKFLGKNITLTSTNPEDSNVVAATVISGIGRGEWPYDMAVMFRGTEDSNCTLAGFNIKGKIIGRDGFLGPNDENYTHASITHCLLQENRVSGGTVIALCDGLISNCVVTDNETNTLSISPPIYKRHGLIENCTVLNNRGMGIGVLEAGTTTVKNCICSIYVANEATVNVSYSAILMIGVANGPFTINWGPGNITYSDPCIPPEPYWPPNYWQHNCWQLVEGDYRLKSQAGRWDPNSRSWVKDDVTSPCIDAGDPGSPIGDEAFPNGGIINMGAYGGTTEASKSYFGQPPCETIVAGDINGDCKVDFADFQLMALHWLEDNRD